MKGDSLGWTFRDMEDARAVCGTICKTCFNEIARDLSYRQPTEWDVSLFVAKVLEGRRRLNARAGSKEVRRPFVPGHISETPSVRAKIIYEDWRP